MKHTLRAMVARIKPLEAHTVTTWDVLDARQGSGFEQFRYTQVGQIFGRAFGDYAIGRGSFGRRDTHEGEVLSLTAYAFTREELMALLEEAFTKGRECEREHARLNSIKDMGSAT